MWLLKDHLPPPAHSPVCELVLQQPSLSPLPDFNPLTSSPPAVTSAAPTEPIASNPPAVLSQGNQMENLFPPQFVESLISKVAEEVLCRISTLDGTPSGLSRLSDVAVCPSHSTPPYEEVASSVVQSSVANATASFTGLSVQSATDVPGQLFLSAGLPVDANIWNPDYIDFGALLTNPVFENQYRITITVQGADSSNVPSLCLEPFSKPKKIISIELWLSSFHVFVGLYT